MIEVTDDLFPSEILPLIDDLCSYRETLWLNPKLRPFAEVESTLSLTMADVLDAEARLERFKPYLAKVFPETAFMDGLIESPFRDIPSMQAQVFAGQEAQAADFGRLLLKCDNALPISGSIKARGGIYEVLCQAEKIALASGLLKAEDSYVILAEERFKELFSQYSMAVGSTGNLGLSIGIMSAKLGFKVTVHMSADAREWKKALLRSKGVTVVEYAADYSRAISVGRKLAAQDPSCHFVDDENSTSLFLGYAVAALRLKRHFEAAGIFVNAEHPLFVYLPCGVGGGPGGVAFGLKLVFGDHVHCLFAEPTHSPCMLLGMASGFHEKIAVQDIFIDNRTAADGLAVGRPSGFVGRFLEPLLSGCYTLPDQEMMRLLALLADSEGIYLEPSALAGMNGILQWQEEAGKRYLEQQGLTDKMSKALHLVWATGGGMVPRAEMDEFYSFGKSLSEAKPQTRPESEAVPELVTNTEAKAKTKADPKPGAKAKRSPKAKKKTETAKKTK